MSPCHLLFRALNFEPEGIQPCCNVRGEAVPLYAFSGGPLDMADYARYVTELITRLRNGSPLCANCPEPRLPEGEKNQPEARDFCIDSLSFNQHRHICDCQCMYCDLWRTPVEKAPYTVLPVLQGLAAQGFLSPRCTLSWGGGEPGLLPEFAAVCRWAMDAKYYQFVHTNGLRFSPAIAQMLAEGGGTVNISLDAGNARTYAKIKGKNAWKQVLANLEKYIGARVIPEQVELKYIIFDENNAFAQIEDFFRFCLLFGITHIQYSLDFREVNRGAVSEKSLLAAAFFILRARDLEMTAESFYIDRPMAERIAAQVARLRPETGEKGSD